MENLINKITLADCMDIMKDMPDKCIDLAIVDPPYGIGASEYSRGGTQHGKSAAVCKEYKHKKWDSEIPDESYFMLLKYKSKNQIIWGGNYFIAHLSNTPCFIVWDKNNGDNNYADCELAWTSFESAVRKVKVTWHGMIQENMKEKEIRIHPTQKPIQLYRWLLQNYAKPNDLILDTHSGSGSCACACHLEKYDFIAIEKDKDYHRDSVARLNELRAQGVLF